MGEGVFVHLKIEKNGRQEIGSLCGLTQIILYILKSVSQLVCPNFSEYYTVDCEYVSYQWNICQIPLTWNQLKKKSNSVHKANWQIVNQICHTFNVLKLVELFFAFVSVKLQFSQREREKPLTDRIRDGE